MTGNELKEIAKRYPVNQSVFGISNLSLDKLPFDSVAKAIKDDERVLLSFGSNLTNAGKKVLQHVAVCITDKRLLLSGKPNSFIGTFMESGVMSVKLDKINSVGVVGTGVTINTIGDEDYTFMNYSPDTRNKLSSEIQEIIDDNKAAFSANSATTIVQQKSPAELIKEFKELLDQGIITQEEFDQKKKQLLGL